MTARGVIEHPRPLVRTAEYVGPDPRRREDQSYAGLLRRHADKPVTEID